MNDFQRVWWEQVKSDHAVFDRLRRSGADACHLLHYLQMTTEKLGKAYFWRNGEEPPRVHSFFCSFLRQLLNASPREKPQIATAFDFDHFDRFRNWVKHSKVMEMAHELQRIAPSLANDGPNAEYPWPSSEPIHSPARYKFPLWEELNGAGRGRSLLKVIRAAVDQFPLYA